MENFDLTRKQSMFSKLRNVSVNKSSIDRSIQDFEDQVNNSDLSMIQLRLNQISATIYKENGTIDEMIKDLELCLPTGNNNKKLFHIFYQSKAFLDLVVCVNNTNPKYLEKLLVFIEKLLRGNKYIAKYLSKNIEFLKRIFVLMKNPVRYFIY